MIIFHEGMPRSGKSYASTKDHIVPALAKGRKVYARLDGLNYEKLAELACITLDKCRELLIEISEEQTINIFKLEIDNDSLIVIDELQNYWPQGRAPLSPEMLKFIAEHGHHGLDILAMGQLLKDCHRNWVNRTNRKIQFVKKDMLGKPNEYKWMAYTGRPDKNGVVKFDIVAKGDGVYEEKYFGCYSSHSTGTENTKTYEDDRANVFKTKAFRLWIPLAGISAALAVAYIVYLFTGGLAPKEKKVAGPLPVSVTVERTHNGQPVSQDVKKEAVKADVKSVDNDLLDMPDVVADLSKANRIRVAYYGRSAAGVRVVIEWRDTSQKLVDQLEVSDLELLGWHVLADGHGRVVILARPGHRLVATAWPLDVPEGKVTEASNDNIKALGGAPVDRNAVAPVAGQATEPRT